MTTDRDPNAQYRIAAFALRTLTVRVYILKPGQCFERFGGSRAGLTVNRTASLIVSEYDEAGGVTDREFDIDNRGAWERIFKLHRAAALANPQEVVKP